MVQGKLPFSVGSEKLNLHSTLVAFTWCPRKASSPVLSAGPHPLLPQVAQPVNPELAASSPFVSLPLKPHPGAAYWSGSCPVDLILRSLSCSQRRMGFTYCFSLLHDWVCATDDTWHCPLPAWRRAVPEPLYIKQTLSFYSGKVRTLLGESTWASS